MSAFKNDDDDIYLDNLPLRQYAAQPGTDAVDPHRGGTAQVVVSLLNHPEISKQSISERQDSFSPVQQKDHVGVKRSFMKLLLPGLGRCTISWVLTAAFYVSVWGYKDRVISPRTKSGFDVVTVALSIAFGMNVASSLKGTALDLRWWVLSKKKRSSREVDLILHCDSMTELLRLVYVAPRPRTIIVCISWLSLNLFVQIAIAVLGLTYSTSPGIEDIYRAPGMNDVSVPNMTHFAPNTGRFTNYFGVESFAAHVLGNIGSSYNFSMLPDDPLTGTPWASNPAAFWNGTDHWAYVFLDSAPSVNTSGPNFLSVYTDRVVNSTGTCETPPYQMAADGDLAVIQLLKSNQTVIFPGVALGQESIYYLTTPVDPKSSNGSCGPGCSNVKVLEPAAGPPVAGSISQGSNSTHYYYDCNITLTSTTDDVSPLNKAIAAQAIALSGQIHPELRSIKEDDNEYVSYNFGLPFGEAQNNSATGMASLISRFAIGVIAAAAQTNPPMYIQGGQPAQGVRLEFESLLAFNLILGSIGLLQLVLVIVTAVVVSQIVIPQEIPLSHEEEIRKRFVSSS